MTIEASRGTEMIAEDCNVTGMQLYRKQLFEPALTSFNEAVTLNPGNADYYFHRCLCQSQLKNYNCALQDARKCLELNPRHCRAYEQQVDCLIFLGHLSCAKQCLTVTQENNSFVFKRTRTIEDCKRTLKAFKNQVKLRNYNVALSLIENLLTCSTHSEDFILKKADVLVSMRRLTDARAIVDTILSIDSGKHNAYSIRGKINYFEEHFNAAISDFERALQLPTLRLRSQIESYLVYANIYLTKKEASFAVKVNDFNKAYKLYSKALEIDRYNDHENAKLCFNLSIVVNKLENTNQAVEYCTRAIELNPNYVKAYLRRAYLWRRLRKVEESIRDFEKVIELEPNEEFIRLLIDTNIEFAESIKCQMIFD